MAFVHVKKCLKDPKQLAKLVVLIICICITIYQFAGCVSKLITPPITSYYKFERNETLKYPAVTICRKPAYKTDQWPKYGVASYPPTLNYEKVFDQFPFNSTTINEFLEQTTYSIDEISTIYGFNNKGWGENLEVTYQYFHLKGFCFKLRPTENADKSSYENGYFFYFKHNTTDKSRDSFGFSTSGFEIYIHGEHEVISDFENTDINFVYLESAEEMQVTLTSQSFSQISTNDQRCVDDATYSISKCKEKCLHSNIAKEIGCTTLWLWNVDGTYPTCADPESVNKLIQILGNSIQLNKFLEQCNCKDACNNTIYNFNVEQRKDADIIMGKSSILILYFKSNLLFALTEVTTYDWYVFMADVGGSLGFLLGLSVIGIINILEEMIRIIFSKKQIKKNSNNKDNESKENNISGKSLKSVMEFVNNCEIYDTKTTEVKF